MSRVQRTARAAHTCSGCGQRILAGTPYIDERRAGQPGLAFRWHRDCTPQARQGVDYDASMIEGQDMED